MDSGNLEIFSNHFEVPKPSVNTAQPANPVKTDTPSRSYSRLILGRRPITTAKMMKLLSFRGRPWSSNSTDNEKVEMSIADVQSLRSEISCAEEREGYLRAQLEHVDAILKSARLAGYLHIRTRWTALPGELPIIEDIDIDDWLPRFVVLHGCCLFFYLQSTDLSPQDTTMLANVVEVGKLPSFKQEEEMRYAFYILTSHGLRYECSSLSKILIDLWETTLRSDCNLEATAISDA